MIAAPHAGADDAAPGGAAIVFGDELTLPWPLPE